MPTTHRSILAAVLCLSLTGCASTMGGLDGESKFACKAPDGVTCSSLSGVYANAVANNLPSLRKDGKDGKDAHAAKPGARITGQTASSGDPIRSPQKVLRIWIAPWEDGDGDLHDQSYTYVVAEKGRWQIEHNRNRIAERYRPTFINANKQAVTPTQQPVRPAAPLALPDGFDRGQRVDPVFAPQGGVN